MTEPIGGYQTVDALLAGLERGEKHLTISATAHLDLLQRFVRLEATVSKLAELAHGQRP